jgi:NADH-quinone oxidoreductase subunit C
MESTAVIDILQHAVPGAAFEAGPATDQPTIYVPRERLVETMTVLRDHPALQFSLLADMTATDWPPREPRFELVCHLACLGVPGSPEGAPAPPPARLRVKVGVPGDDPRVPTLSGVWPVANWLEREVWDLFGIVFDGHPDLRRLLMPEDWEGHPLRKDYPVQVRMAARASSPLQLSPEQFAANIAAARRAAESGKKKD